MTDWQDWKTLLNGTQLWNCGHPLHEWRQILTKYFWTSELGGQIRSMTGQHRMPLNHTFVSKWIISFIHAIGLTNKLWTFSICVLKTPLLCLVLGVLHQSRDCWGNYLCVEWDVKPWSTKMSIHSESIVLIKWRILWWWNLVCIRYCMFFIWACVCC